MTLQMLKTRPERCKVEEAVDCLAQESSFGFLVSSRYLLFVLGELKKFVVCPCQGLLGELKKLLFSLVSSRHCLSTLVSSNFLFIFLVLPFSGFNFFCSIVLSSRNLLFYIGELSFFALPQ